MTRSSETKPIVPGKPTTARPLTRKFHIIQPVVVNQNTRSSCWASRYATYLFTALLFGLIFLLAAICWRPISEAMARTGC